MNELLYLVQGVTMLPSLPLWILTVFEWGKFRNGQFHSDWHSFMAHLSDFRLLDGRINFVWKGVAEKTKNVKKNLLHVFH